MEMGSQPLERARGTEREGERLRKERSNCFRARIGCGARRLDDQEVRLRVHGQIVRRIQRRRENADADADAGAGMERSSVQVKRELELRVIGVIYNYFLFFPFVWSVNVIQSGAWFRVELY